MQVSQEVFRMHPERRPKKQLQLLCSRLFLGISHWPGGGFGRSPLVKGKEIYKSHL